MVVRGGMVADVPEAKLLRIHAGAKAWISVGSLNEAGSKRFEGSVAFISPFVGRVDDVGMDGLTLISDITRIYANYPEFKTEVLVASVRNPVHIVESAKMGAHVATLPYSVMKQLVQHPLTDKGLAQFVKDWESTGQKIA